MAGQQLKADAVFEGGGVKGIALVGALQAMEEAGYAWQNVAGASAGAITAALLAVGYSAAELKMVMDERVRFHAFKDAVGIGRLPLVGPALSLLTSRGMYQGDYFLNLMRQLIAEKTGARTLAFGDPPLVLPKEPGDSEEDYRRKYRYKLQLIASDISRNEMLVLPRDADRLGLEPDRLEVAWAVRMSMSIPFFFRPVIVPERGRPRRKHWIVDGGMLSNFPIWLFDAPDPEWPTFGFLLWEPGSGDQHFERIRDPVSMVRAMVNTMTGAHDRRTLAEAGMDRVIAIPTGRYTTTDFDLTAEDRHWLYDSGYKAGREFLSGWDFEAHKARRRAALR